MERKMRMSAEIAPKITEMRGQWSKIFKTQHTNKPETQCRIYTCGINTFHKQR